MSREGARGKWERETLDPGTAKDGPAQEPSQEETEGFSRPQSKPQSNRAEPRTLVCPAAIRNQGSGRAPGVDQGLAVGSGPIQVRHTGRALFTWGASFEKEGEHTDQIFMSS